MTAGPSRPVGRGAKMRAAVYAATLRELADRGYAELSVESIALRAGVHKTTIYRTWGNRESVVLAALTSRNETKVPVPDTGSVETDLVELATLVADTIGEPGGRALLAALLSDAARVPRIGTVLREFFTDRFRRATPVVTRAIERGELPADTDPLELLETLIAPIYLRLTMTAEPIDAAVATRAAHVALTAARAGLLCAARSGAATD